MKGNKIMDSIMPPRAAINTLEASWFEYLCAKWFGKKSVGVDPTTGVVVKLSFWRGKTYMISWKEQEL